MPTEEIFALKKNDILHELSHIYKNCKIYVFFEDDYYVRLKVTIRHKWLNIQEIHFVEILDISVVSNENNYVDLQVAKIVSAVDKDILRMWKG